MTKLKALIGYVSFTLVVGGIILWSVNLLVDYRFRNAYLPTQSPVKVKPDDTVKDEKAPISEEPLPGAFTGSEMVLVSKKGDVRTLKYSCYYQKTDKTIVKVYKGTFTTTEEVPLWDSKCL